MFDRLRRWVQRVRATVAMRPATGGWHALLEQMPDGVLLARADGNILYANPAAARLLGRRADQLAGSLFEAPLVDGTTLDVPGRRPGRARTTLTLHVRGIRWHDGAAWLVALHDSTETQRLQTLKTERMQVLERMAQGARLDEVLHAVARFIEAQYPESMCSVMLADADGRYLHPAVSPHLPEALTAAFASVPIGPAQGSCGTAAHTRAAVIVDDIAASPLWAAWRGIALDAGVRACWSIPILSSRQQLLGTFAIYHRQPHQPDADELELAHACAHIAGIAIERHQAEQQLALLQTSIDHLNDLIIVTHAEPLDEPGPRIVFVNQSFVRRTGYAAAEVLNRSPRLLQGPLTERAELDRIRSALQARQSVRAELINYTKSGQPFWLQMDIVAVTDASGQPTHLVAVERDITESKRAQAAAQRAVETQVLIARTQREIAEAAGGTHAAMALLTGCALAIAGAEGAALLLADDGVLVYRSVAGLLKAYQGLPLALEGELARTAAQLQEPQCCADSEADARIDRDACRALGVRSLLCVPLALEGGTTAVLSVHARRTDAFGTSDAVNLRILLDSLGAAMQRERAGERIRRSEAQYRMLFEHNPQPMWVFDRANAAILAVNRAAVEHYGYSREEFLRMHIWDLRTPEESERLAGQMNTFPTGRLNAGLWKHRLKSGGLIDVEIISDEISFDGRPARLVLAHDVSRRIQAERELTRLAHAQRMLSHCNEALLRTDDEQKLLDAICRIAVEDGGYSLAWVGYVEQDERQSVKPVAWAGAHVGYVQEIRISRAEDQPEGHGPVGRALRSGRPVVVADITQDPDFRPWAEAALRYALRAAVTLPLRGARQAFGHLTLYMDRPWPIAGSDLELLQQLADNLAYGIRNLRARRERRKLHQSVASMATAVAASADAAFFEHLALALAEAVDADAAVIARFLPDTPASAHTIAAIIDRQARENFDHILQGTPCEALSGTRECVITDMPAMRFPTVPVLDRLDARAFAGRRLDRSDGQPLGILYALFRRRLQPTEFLGSALDIFAARAAAELERQESDYRLREQASLLDKAQNAITVRDLDQRITYWNKAAERLYGWSFEEVRGRVHAENTYHDPAEFRRIFEAVVRQGEWSGRVRQRCKDGRAITVDLHATLIRDEHGHPRAAFGIITDVTERLALEERLRRSERLEAIGQLTGGVAHDFNNLLTVILGNAEIMAEQLQDAPRLRELAEMVRTAAQRGGELTHRLLAFARRQPLEPRPVQVNALISAIDGLLRRALGSHIEIELAQGAGLWEAMVDPAQLENALLNLCLNARDAMPAGGRLTIETSNTFIDQAYADQHADVRPGQYVLVAVSDTGTGMSPELIERAFEPFFTTKESGKGTGLGLSMVYGFIKQSRGHIKIYSEPGAGTTVKMYLPRAARRGGQAMPHPAPEPALEGHETILVVEDDALVRRFAMEQLRDLGYRVIGTRDAAEALQRLRKDTAIDLLFTDVMMPGGMNGRQLAEAACALRPSLRVLYTSGYTQNAIIHHGHLDQGVVLLNKPYSRTSLARKVRQALSEPPHEP